jgi:hypothetical protein
LILESFCWQGERILEDQISCTKISCLEFGDGLKTLYRIDMHF